MIRKRAEQTRAPRNVRLSASLAIAALLVCRAVGVAGAGEPEAAPKAGDVIKFADEPVVARAVGVVTERFGPNLTIKPEKTEGFTVPVQDTLSLWTKPLKDGGDDYRPEDVKALERICYGDKVEVSFYKFVWDKAFPLNYKWYPASVKVLAPMPRTGTLYGRMTNRGWIRWIKCPEGAEHLAGMRLSVAVSLGGPQSMLETFPARKKRELLRRWVDVTEGDIIKVDYRAAGTLRFESLEKVNDPAIVDPLPDLKPGDSFDLTVKYPKDVRRAAFEVCTPGKDFLTVLNPGGNALGRSFYRQDAETSRDAYAIERLCCGDQIEAAYMAGFTASHAKLVSFRVLKVAPRKGALKATLIRVDEDRCHLKIAEGPKGWEHWAGQEFWHMPFKFNEGSDFIKNPTVVDKELLERLRKIGAGKPVVVRYHLGGRIFVDKISTPAEADDEGDFGRVADEPEAKPPQQPNAGKKPEPQPKESGGKPDEEDF